MVHNDASAAFSDIVNVRIANNCLARPTAVSPQDNETVDTSRVVLDWSENACATRWLVIVRQDNAHGSIAYKQANVTRSQLTTDKLKANKTYVWRVAACNQNGCRRSAWFKFYVAKQNVAG